MRSARSFVIAMAVLAAACSANPAAVPSAAATVSATAIPTPSPTATPSPSPVPPPTTAQLASAYLWCANAGNKAITALRTQYKGLLPLKSLKTYSAKAAAIDGTFIKCIRAVAWTGSPLTTDIHTLLIRMASVQVTELAEAKATSIREYEGLVKIETTQDLAYTSAANVVRGDLGLPPPPI
jgi:hypothetical protein